jgi:hypothetical protein
VSHSTWQPARRFRFRSVSSCFNSKLVPTGCISWRDATGAALARQERALVLVGRLELVAVVVVVVVVFGVGGIGGVGGSQKDISIFSSDRPSSSSKAKS